MKLFHLHAFMKILALNLMELKSFEQRIYFSPWSPTYEQESVVTFRCTFIVFHCSRIDAEHYGAAVNRKKELMQESSSATNVTDCNKIF